jgi:uncharacterized protein (TIGR03086 family)
MADLITNVRDDMLGAPTPCPAYTLGDLVEHVGGLAVAFTAAATKDIGGASAQGPSGDASRLSDDWRTSIPGRLVALATAWSHPEAWTGMTRAGGVDLPDQVAGVVALDELVIHGWDVARASGQAYDCDPQSLDAVHAFLAETAAPGQEAMRRGIFGPVIPVSDGAPPMVRVVGLAGRDPHWTAET